MVVFDILTLSHIPQSLTLISINDGLFGFKFFSVAEKQAVQKKPQKARKKFHFFVYSPEHDRECDAVKVISSLLKCLSSL